LADYFLNLIRGQRCGPLAALQRAGLGLLSGPYGLGVCLRNRLYDGGWKQTIKVPVPVVSVGNLTLGGTGKTPCVEHVARFYRGLDLRVAILSRGYGNTGGRNDEALVLEENLPDVPHYQGADRAALAHLAIAESESQVLVLDDGFQHRRLGRDLDLVLLDSTEPWGHGRLFPRGLLREPRSALRRAGLVVLTRCDQAAPEALARLRREVARLGPEAPAVETTHRPVELVNAAGEAVSLEQALAHPLALFCGVGNPEAFRQTFRGLGGQVAAWRSFPDHHPYSCEDVKELRTWARQQARDCVIVTTQKDLVKLRLTRLGDHELWALRIRLHVTAGQETLDRKLKEALR
jgi:tetraacyldisaccharide 4'-kinase